MRPLRVLSRGAVSELDAIVSQDRVDPVRNGFQQVFHEFPCCSSVSFVDQLSDCELAGAVDVHEQIELAFGSLHLGNIHEKNPDVT